MPFYPGDIIVTNERGERTVWISEEAVIRELGLTYKYLSQKARYEYKKFVPERYQKQAIMPKTGKAWRYARINKRYYYAYGNIPDKKPANYRRQLPPEPKLIELAAEVETNAAVKKAIEILINEIETMPQQRDIEYYMSESIPTFSLPRAADLAYLKALYIRLYEWHTQKRYKQFGIKTQEDLLTGVIGMINERKLYGFGIKAAVSFRKKIINLPTHPDDIRSYMISGWLGNDNARQVGKYDVVDQETGEIMKYDAHETLMFYLYMNPDLPQKEYETKLYERYKEAIQNMGIIPVAYRTFCFHIANFATNALMARQRHGSQHTLHKIRPYTPFKHLEFAHSLWSADGSGSKLEYRHNERDGKRAIGTLFAVRISDVASRYVAGFALGLREGEKLVIEAVKMAITNGNNMSVFELITDNSPHIKNSEVLPYLKVIFDKVRHITPKVSQQNPEETHIRLLTEACRDQINWKYSGFNASDVNSRPNEDFQLKWEDLPDYDHAVLQFHQLVDRYNNTPWGDGRTPRERFENNKHNGCRKLSDIVLRYAFGNKTEVDLSYMRGFVVVHKVVHGETKKYMYEIPNYLDSLEQVARANGYENDAKVFVRFNEHAADVYSSSDTYLFTCKPAQKAAKGYAEATDDNDKILGKNKNRVIEFDERVKQFEADVIEAADKLTYNDVVRLNNNKKAKDDHYEIIRSEENRMPRGKKTKEPILTPEEQAMRDI